MCYVCQKWNDFINNVHIYNKIYLRNTDAPGGKYGPKLTVTLDSWTSYLPSNRDHLHIALFSVYRVLNVQG